MPNGRFMPLTKISRCCAAPVCCGSRITMISPAPVSARKISPLGATVSHLGRLKSAAYTFKRNPAGTVGRKPAGGFALRGPLPAELVANGTGSFGFWPCVSCDSGEEGRKNVKDKIETFRARMLAPPQKNDNRFALYIASSRRPVPIAAVSRSKPCRIGSELLYEAGLPPSNTHRTASNRTEKEETEIASWETSHEEPLSWTRHPLPLDSS